MEVTGVGGADWMFIVSGNHNTKRSASHVAVGRITMREVRRFGMSERGGSKGFVAAAALLACLPACGSITPTGTTEPVEPINQQATCTVTRTECLGWAKNEVDKLDGRTLNCPPANLILTGPFDATVCYQVKGGATTAEQKTAADNACNTAYCTGGFNGLYPLSTAVGNGMVTCQATAKPDKIANEKPGQCAKTTTPSNGATTFALCTLGGRQCNGRDTASDTTSFCTSMPPVASGQSASTCFDATKGTAEVACQRSWQWPTTPPGAVDNTDQFHFVNVADVQVNDSEDACLAELGPTQAYGFAGPMGTFSMNGTTTNLTAKAGSMRIGVSCDSESEFCTSRITSMKVELADVTVAGLTLHNLEATLIKPASANFGSTTIPANALSLEIEGDITAIGRTRTVFSNPQPLTLTTNSTTASLSGAFSATVETSLVGAASVTGNIAITGSTTSPNTTCGDQTPLQQLLGFETTADWSSQQVQVALTTSRRTQGCFGLEVGGANFRTVNSTKFATPLPGTTGTLALDVFNPGNPPNPFWLGAVQMYLSCPSANFNNQYIGQVELTGLPQNKFSTLNYPIPGAIRAVLQGAHPDCFFSISVNANQTPTPPVLDNLRFK